MDWWLSVRKFGASLVIGGMGLSWLIVKLQGKQTANSKEVGEERLRKVCSKNRSLRGHVLPGNECYTINIVYVIVGMLL